jgi:2-hydroxy-3-keto-5-methylthiopentenyl-1-phosphate phosphatase
MVGIDKKAVVRDALSRYERVIFAGDGPPDLGSALLVDSDNRFARGFLAQELRRLGERFHAFENWSEIVRSLVGGGNR